MRFYFPDSQDQVDPSFDFETETRSPFRLRQRDDLYAHEALATVPFTGLLVSKPIVDGINGAAGRYTNAQRQRLYRVGVREFFRLDRISGPRIATIGDCGAFTYVNEDAPPYTIDEVIDFYEECGFDAGLSVDHVILGFTSERQPRLPGVDDNVDEWTRRRRLTLALAREFMARTRRRNVSFEPIGVAQGFSPSSYADSVAKLQRMGYKRVALGGMVALKTPDIIACLEAISRVRDSRTQLHLLGVTRCESIGRFQQLGVTSFDSTSPFRQAFMDDRDNYYTLDGAHAAIRVPQLEGNAKLKRRVLAGEVDQTAALRLEAAALRALREFDRGKTSRKAALRTISDYTTLLGVGRDRTEEHERLLADAPWKSCPCGLCERLGVDVAIFRGTERNKSRGFHNLFVFQQRLQRLGLKPAAKRRVLAGAS